MVDSSLIRHGLLQSILLLILHHSMNDLHQASLHMIPLGKDWDSIPQKRVDGDYPIKNFKVDDNTTSPSKEPDSFECPIVFEEFFELNHRCEIDKTIMELESFLHDIDLRSHISVNISTTDIEKAMQAQNRSNKET